MHRLVPNSDGDPERDLAEFNACHNPSDGKFCSGKGSWRRTLKGRTVGKRAAHIARLLDDAMQQVGGNVNRALALRRRYDKVSAPLARQRRASLWRQLTEEGSAHVHAAAGDHGADRADPVRGRRHPRQGVMAA